MDRYPPWSWKKTWGQPSLWQKRLWRRKARRKQNRTVSLCRDWDELTVETRTRRLTSLFDWI